MTDFSTTIHGRQERVRFIPHCGRATHGPSRLDQFAEYLAAGFSPQDSAEFAGYQRKSGNAMVQRLRERLGWQAR